jgi:hypothetical protein
MSLPTPEDEAKEEEILRVARRLPTAQRPAYVEERCRGDAAMRERIELMLTVIDASAFREPAPIVTRWNRASRDLAPRSVPTG